MAHERPGRIERRLSAIMAADVADYSRLMHNDEEATHAALTALLADVVEPVIAEHGGHIVKNTGDGCRDVDAVPKDVMRLDDHVADVDAHTEFVSDGVAEDVITRDLRPSPNSRHRFEPPFETIFDPDVWQYCEKPLKAGEIIETREWPHSSFHPLNYGAGKVLDFFNNRTKSRLPRSPWYDDRIRLDDGLTGLAHVEIVRPKAPPSAGHFEAAES